MCPKYVKPFGKVVKAPIETWETSAPIHKEENVNQLIRRIRGR